MRKCFIVLMLSLIILGTASAEESIETQNGYNWVTWSPERKVSFVQGYYTACVMMMAMAIEVNQQSLTESQFQELVETLKNQFYYSDSIGVMASKIDAFYASPSNRKFAIYRLLPFIGGKEWWNRDTGEVDTPSRLSQSGTS